MDYKELARRFRLFIESMSVNATDEEALNNIEAFPLWKVGMSLKKDMRVRYNDALFKVLQDHTSQSDWTPDIAVSLFVKVSLDEFPDFVQPTGSHDAYNKGDKVTFEGKHYESLIDGNVWSPKDYPQGWKEV